MSALIHHRSLSRNNSPDRQKLRAKLNRRRGLRAYACQCSWFSVLEPSDLRGQPQLTWVCSKHHGWHSTPTVSTPGSQLKAGCTPTAVPARGGAVASWEVLFMKVGCWWLFWCGFILQILWLFDFRYSMNHRVSSCRMWCSRDLVTAVMDVSVQLRNSWSVSSCWFLTNPLYFNSWSDCSCFWLSFLFFFWKFRFSVYSTWSAVFSFLHPFLFFIFYFPELF